MTSFSIPVILTLVVLAAIMVWLAYQRQATQDAAQRRLIAMTLGLTAASVAWLAMPRLPSIMGFEALKPFVGAIGRFIGTLWWLLLASVLGASALWLTQHLTLRARRH